jgi:hypothetical protein
MNWTAEAPVPTTATVLPFRSIFCGQLVEWNASPRKLSRPFKSGINGLLDVPIADKTNRARYSPWLVSISHSPAASSQATRWTFVEKRTCGSTPAARVHCLGRHESPVGAKIVGSSSDWEQRTTNTDAIRHRRHTPDSGCRARRRQDQLRVPARRSRHHRTASSGSQRQARRIRNQ